MRFSKVLLLGLAGAAMVVFAKRIIKMKSEGGFWDDDLEFDTDFIPGSKKLHLDIPDHIDPSWFRVAKFQSEDTDPMFI